jgi:hypothetical protein
MYIHNVSSNSSALNGKTRGRQISQKSTSHLKILGARTLTWSTCRTEDAQTLGDIVQNVFVRATWRPGIVHPWSPRCKDLNAPQNYVIRTFPILRYVKAGGTYSNHWALKGSFCFPTTGFFTQTVWYRMMWCHVKATIWIHCPSS